MPTQAQCAQAYQPTKHPRRPKYHITFPVTSGEAWESVIPICKANGGTRVMCLDQVEARTNVPIGGD